jgi:hypothetical protein
MSKTITYAIHPDGYTVSRVGSEVAWPVLEYDKIGRGGDFTRPFSYKLKKSPVLSALGRDWNELAWTKKLPVEIKNIHRAFWGLKPLSEPKKVWVGSSKSSAIPKGHPARRTRR